MRGRKKKTKMKKSDHVNSKHLLHLRIVDFHLRHLIISMALLIGLRPIHSGQASLFNHLNLDLLRHVHPRFPSVRHLC